MNGKKQVLFVGPVYMDIYKDVIDGFKMLDCDVDFIKERQRNNDPQSARYEFYRLHIGIERKKAQYWKDILNSPAYDKKYDILFVIDGQGLHPVLFEMLKKRNPDIKCVNYLFDTTYGVYHFENFFHFYDKVYTFDRAESERYGINLLPIYWVPPTTDDASTETYDMFGFGAYNATRYDVFTQLNSYCQKKQMKAFVKLYEKMVSNERLYQLKCVVRKMMGLPAHLPLSHYHSNIITHTTISPKDFRKYIVNSRITIDTHPGHQDGLTARFMWALGAGKKIITTNVSVSKYDFYTPLQIFILTDETNIENNSDFDHFVVSDMELPVAIRQEIDNYRIDNWLRTICEV